MGFLDRILGRAEGSAGSAAPEPRSADEQAIARYRYLLRTAPPDAIEQAHAEAFAQLSPAQRQQILSELAPELPASERNQAVDGSDPRALARIATRAELRQPGFLERTLGPRPGMVGGMGVGGMFAGSLLSSIAGTFIGTAIAHQFLGGFDEHGASEDSASSATDEHEAYAASDEADAGGDEGLDGGDVGGDDFDV